MPQEIVDIPRPDHKGKEKIVTFLGRLTMQKGPEYFVEAANMVLHRTRNVRFCMAGSGDMMDQMIILLLKEVLRTVSISLVLCVGSRFTSV